MDVVSPEELRIERSIVGSDRPFGTKVHELHDHWEEIRQLAPVHRRRDRASQLAMLQFIYEWCAEAAVEIRDAYGDEFVELTEAIDLEAPYPPGFFIRLGPGQQLSADLRCDDLAADRWDVQLRLRFQGEPNWVLAHWAPRTANWTRHQVEDLILTLLSSMERSQGTRPRTG